jgi:hypothetical protein
MIVVRASTACWHGHGFHDVALQRSPDVQRHAFVAAAIESRPALLTITV